VGFPLCPSAHGNLWYRLLALPTRSPSYTDDANDDNADDANDDNDDDDDDDDVDDDDSLAQLPTPPTAVVPTSSSWSILETSRPAQRYYNISILWFFSVTRTFISSMPNKKSYTKKQTPIQN
jgi:hypothetical protein